MPASCDILEQLCLVDAERRRRSADPGLSAKVQAIKHYQQRRFMHTYADLLASPRYGLASRFFLDELYGPTDFSERDEQFARVVPALVRLFPKEIVATVLALSELHALSERLDTSMGENLPSCDVNATTYVVAWQAVGHVADREHQIALTLSVAESLDGLTRRPLVRNSLRLMRGPARAAGLADLQRFLESGFDAFKAMRGARQFIDLIAEREGWLASALFQSGERILGSTNEILPD